MNKKMMEYIEDAANADLSGAGYDIGMLYERGMRDGQIKFARSLIKMFGAVAVAAPTSSSAITDTSSSLVDSINLDHVRFLTSQSGQEVASEVECIGVCESVGRFVSETPSDGGIIDSIGDAVGGAVSVVGDVLSSIAD
jgi:hypothetical protein